ncbi:MAG TPA: c-type cytochrome biogenesis protein CcsB [Candidatus Ozemobacteraceae bacterium]|nr:c-type cytochrome biogenesis protein CcsB [Candidatus Ozemobacteraceae bacterium]HQG28408.1 c-type cytochrome biogenesis protein CcsB [Candidatus Ozemobacteraceae bacterium]
MNLETGCFTMAMCLYMIAFIGHAAAATLNRGAWYSKARAASIAAAAIATAALGLRWTSAGHPPLSNMYESLVTLSTFLAWVSVVFTRKTPIALAEAGSAVLAVLMIGVASVFARDARPLVPALQSYWLYLHVAVAFLGEACFALAFVLSYLFCLRRLIEGRTGRAASDEPPPAEGGEKTVCALVVAGLPTAFLAVMAGLARRYIEKGSPGEEGRTLVLWVVLPVLFFLGILIFMAYLYRGVVGRTAERWLPSAATLDDLTYRAIALGYPLFTVGAIIFGMVWANKAWGRYWGWDPKETWALITFLVYSLYLHVRLTRGWRGTWTAFLSITGFLVTLFTLFGVNLLLSGLHSYASM